MGAYSHIHAHDRIVDKQHMPYNPTFLKVYSLHEETLDRQKTGSYDSMTLLWL